MEALGSPVRREILRLVWDREVTAGDIAAAFDLSKPTISQHLGVLRTAGLVNVTRAGTSRRYRARREALAGFRAALDDPAKWTPADDVPERSLADARTCAAVVVSVDVEAGQADAFKALTDSAVYSRWLGAPVTIDGNRFSATMEWGTEVRGTYELTRPPELIVMRWDFADGNVPVPGAELTGYLRITPAAGGAHVEVHQLVDDMRQAEFMRSAWSMVLGRLKAGIVAALDPSASAPPHPKRAKRAGRPRSA
jgi:DNA-binding transcriptional ArsR family regulator